MPNKKVVGLIKYLDRIVFVSIIVVIVNRYRSDLGS